MSIKKILVSLSSSSSTSKSLSESSSISSPVLVFSQSLRVHASVHFKLLSTQEHDPVTHFHMQVVPIPKEKAHLRELDTYKEQNAGRSKRCIIAQ